MQKIKILIVEDNIIIANALKVMLTDLGYEVPTFFRAGKDLLNKYNYALADIILMDIHLEGDLNGVDTAAMIAEKFTTPIIFITNNTNEHLRKKAVSSINAYQYINKPFNKLDIQTAIELTLKFLKRDELILQDQAPSYLMNDCIFLRKGIGFKKVLISDIMYLKADGSYCELIHGNEKNVFSENLMYFEKKLSFAKTLIRIHRSYIINTIHIQKVQGNRLWIGNTEIPIGKTYKDNLNSVFLFL